MRRHPYLWDCFESLDGVNGLGDLGLQGADKHHTHHYDCIGKNGVEMSIDKNGVDKTRVSTTYEGH